MAGISRADRADDAALLAGLGLGDPVVAAVFIRRFQRPVYGLEVHAVQGLSTEDEAGIGDLRELVDLLVGRSVPALFAEASIAPAGVEAVREAAAARGWDVRLPDRQLYSDTLGQPGTPEGTYAGMLLANARLIAEELGQS